jgi:hypothetical protein
MPTARSFLFTDPASTKFAHCASFRGENAITPAIQLGFVFFASGLLLAFFSITGAPWLQRRFGTAPSLYGALSVFAILILLIGVFTDNRWAVIVCVVASGVVGRSTKILHRVIGSLAVKLTRCGRWPVTVVP